MDVAEILKSLTGAFPEAISEATAESEIRAGSYVDKDKVKKVCQYLKDSLQFDHLCSVCGVDYIKRNELEVVYHIASYNHPVVLTLKARLPRENPEIESIVSVYWNANWYERETYELFGILFKNHPNLKPLVLPEDMLGEWPLRKDYEGFPNKTARNLV
ncbi:F420H2 dehydrogenase subunit FpoC [Methanosarcina sp.]|jgi:NADH/F420H2 dehydrogenase subunit C|uniref:F420H2 dehydrogenase subunit FpoC n=1 Tax=Methanosarcina sp. TaxID=2213 RepID=UPI0029884641|nr:F420H2 dehydrogenase subunit FpoC [Methanosarcina sp.]MDW5551113.1 F420H2 dehydrogenase subunit FpoC [Methanosarcina sp.]MDW5552856.1 F420H2 dehydrogenase subunit FpoC [Methanosarcina sp.]MDW5558129.1 F420H2 dehydrogenase subunit FpoC [Methanosarcina sp.]